MVAGTFELLVALHLTPPPGYVPPRLFVDRPTTVGLINLFNAVDDEPEAAPHVIVNEPLMAGTIVNEGMVTFSAGSGASEVGHFERDAFTPGASIVNVEDSAEVTVLRTSEAGALNIFGTGTLTLQPHLATSDPARVLKVRSLQIEEDQGLPTGTLDLTDNGLIVDYSGSTPHDDVKAWITSAYAADTWTGNGITSTTATSESITGVGYAEASDLSLTSFLGQDVDSSSVLARYTYYGDINLGGQVTLADFNIFAPNFGLSNRDWRHGDSTYDGNVNLADFNLLAPNYGLDSFGGHDDPPPSDVPAPQHYTYDELYAMLMGWDDNDVV